MTSVGEGVDKREPLCTSENAMEIHPKLENETTT